MIIPGKDGRHYMACATNDVPRYERGNIEQVTEAVEVRFGGYMGIYRHTMACNGSVIERYFAERLNAANRPLWREVKLLDSR